MWVITDSDRKCYVVYEMKFPSCAEGVKLLVKVQNKHSVETFKLFEVNKII